MRIRSVLFTLGILVLAAPAVAAPVGTFADFVRSFEAKAVAAGVPQSVYASAMSGLTPDPDIPRLVTTQPEFATPIWDYLDSRVTPRRIAKGRAAIAGKAAIFAAIGKRFGVDPAILGAIWGVETDYGAVLSNTRLIRPIVRSLATLAYERQGRVAEDEAELIAALRLVARGPLDARTLTGSWAGAIGHLQVNPTTVLRYGTDGDGDGRIDLVHSLPDALATSAAFLRGLGYRPGIDWGFEVRVPAGFDYTLATRTQMRPISFFAERGVGRVNGRAFPYPDEPVFLYVPAGKDGPKFLMTANYLVLKGYNFSDSYALSVAHLADRLKGGGDFVASWPRGTKFPNLEQRKAIQQALTKLGLYQGAVDGRLGPVTQEAYQRFQAARGETADGFLTLGAFEELTAATR